MASRHHIPVIRQSQVGSDAQENIPSFFKPKTVEFAAGKDIASVIAAIAAQRQVRVVAAPGAGKSVRLPSALLTADNKLVIHCVPSRLLAYSLYDYVRGLDANVSCHFVDEVLTEYPTSGLVFTNSATLVCQSAFWRVMGADVGACLYMDECHESDGGTHVLRNLRTATYGISRYIEASATFGTGDDSKPFAASKLPSNTREIKFNFPAVKDWDLAAKRAPWTNKDVSGHFAFFVDDEAEAQILVRKYQAEGIAVFRMTGRSTPEEWRTAHKHVEASADALCVFVLDYTFRSGFTFPTFNRFIDPCKVGVKTVEAGRTVVRNRALLTFEKHQTKNRGARVAGNNSDYWCAPEPTLNNAVIVEGVEADLACIFYRMLGFRPDSDIGGPGSPFASGAVPNNLFAALTGEEALRCYKPASAWPGTNKPAIVVPEAEPLDLGLPSESSSSSDAAESDAESVSSNTSVARGGVTPSVFTLDTEDSLEGMVSEAQVRDAYRRASQAVPLAKPDLPKQMRRVKSKHRPSGQAVKSGLAALDSFTSSVGLRPFDFNPGEYYVATDSRFSDLSTDFFADGVVGVLNSAGSGSVPGFLRGLSSEVRDEAYFVGLVGYMDAAVRMNAVNALLESLRDRMSDVVVVDQAAFAQWATICRDVLVSAESRMLSAAKVVECMPNGSLRRVSRDSMATEETEVVQALLRMLEPCLQSPVKALESVPTVDLPSELAAACGNYPAYAARIRVNIVGGGFRAKFARRLLAGKETVVDAVAV